MRVALSLCASLLLVTACSAGVTERPPEATPTRTLGPGEEWVPVAPDREIGGAPLLCAGTGWVGGGHVLTGSATDPRLVWMMAGQRYDLEWPVGYSARFTPQLELLNQSGVVVGREGTELIGGCEMAPSSGSTPAIWHVDVPCLSNDDRGKFAVPSLPYCGD